MNAASPPGYDAFRAAYEAGHGALVWRHDVADLLTPVAAFLKLAHGKKFSFLLESVEGGAARGRYSVIGMAPDLIWRCDKGVTSINRNAATAPDAFERLDEAPLDSLRSLIAETRLDVPDTLPPMTGGLSGYLGYDMVRLMEKLPATKPDVLGIPEAILIRPGLFIIFDGVTDEMTIAAPVYPRAGISAEHAYANAETRLSEVVAALERPVPKLAGTMQGPLEQSSNMEEQEFWGVVETAKNYIRAGDVFQVVPSQRFRRPFTLPPFSLYRALRRLNPSPFLYNQIGRAHV